MAEMAEMSEKELHHKIVETLKEGEDPKPFVLDWCKPKCPESKAILERCEEALKIIKGVDAEKTCLFRYRQWVECVENCTQPKIMHNLKSAEGRGKLDGVFDTVWAMRYLLFPLYPLVRLAIGFKRVEAISGQPIE